MKRRGILKRAGALLAFVLASAALFPPPAAALNPIKPVCKVAGWVNGLIGKACAVAQNAPNVIKADKQLSQGHLGKAAKTALGGGSSAASGVASKAAMVVGLTAIGGWVLGGAKSALHETAKVLSQTTTPQLRSTWFSSAYWRMAGIAAVLTLPFLFAAAVQALLRSDLGMLTRAAFGYLPLAMLAVGIAAPVAMLLLVVSDQLSAVVSSAAGNASGQFLEKTSAIVAVLTVIGSPFLAFLIGLFTAAAALVLWLELLVREAAVYVIVLMLPLAFAALVWPARRIWAIRAVELLVALILSKFAIVAVLSLGGAALTASVAAHSVTGAVAGGALVLMAAFAPWALLRLLPLAELAGGAAGPLRADGGAGKGLWEAAHTANDRVGNWLTTMRSQADEGGALTASASDAVAAPGPPSLAPLAGAAEPVVGAAEPAANGAEPAVAPGGDEAHPEADQRATADHGLMAGVSEPGAGVSEHGAGVSERSPGMEERWQAGDFEWEPLPLGFDADEAPVLWPKGGIEGDSSPSGHNVSEDPDPRPAQQPPTEGRL